MQRDVRRDVGRAGRRRAAAGVLLALVLGGSGALPAQAAAPAQAGAAQAQAVLDRVLGPGAAVVEVAATVRTGTTRVGTVRYGIAVTAGSATGTWTSAAGTTGSSLRTDAVDSTSTAVVVPAGGLVRQTVSVAIDRGALGTRSVAGLRRLVAAAVGLSPKRGDRLVVAVTRFARPTAAVAPSRPWMAALLPMAVPALQLAGVLAGALILLRMLGVGRRRRGSAGGLTPR